MDTALVLQSLDERLSVAQRGRAFKIAVERFQLVKLRFVHILHVEVLQSDVLVGFRLSSGILLSPRYLQHLFERHQRHLVLLLALVHLAELLVHEDGLLIVIGFLNKVAHESNQLECLIVQL